MNPSFSTLRKQLLEDEYAHLNDRQREAVFSTGSPLLILAGAGSGKTTAVVGKIGYLMTYGNTYNTEKDGSPDDCAYLQKALTDKALRTEQRYFDLMCENPIPAHNLLAITFTNKAAGEMRERIERYYHVSADELWALTFHSLCVRILRRYINLLGYDNSFTIYDDSDSLKALTACVKDMNLTERYDPKICMKVISKAKSAYIGAEEFDSKRRSIEFPKLGALYMAYQAKLKECNALDFDDLIFMTVRLLEAFPDVRSRITHRFRYILVDEYQDTNPLQYRLVSLLVSDGNICVVGDDDQSIYSFMGADIGNILSFEKQFPGAKVIRLEQNYRSTQVILDAANAVIAHNASRKAKALWTDRTGGEKIEYYRAQNGKSEADHIVSAILSGISKHKKYSDFCVLYRANAQSNTIEHALKFNGIPYRVYGGQQFYKLKEIQDMIAYLNVSCNPNDTVRLLRIINEPKRGIGDTTLERVASIASQTGLTFFDVLCEADRYDELKRSAEKLMRFADSVKDFNEKSRTMTPSEFYKYVLDASGYRESLLLHNDPDDLARIDNLDEFYNDFVQYEKDNPSPTLINFLEETALVSAVDNLNENDDACVLMTMHCAKGLEFDTVFVAGFDDGLFPSARSVNEEGVRGEEEERRLCYVALTRAKSKLYLLGAQSRLVFGHEQDYIPSRFLKEIPKELIEEHRSANVNQFAHSMGLPKKTPTVHHDFVYKPVAQTAPKPVMQNYAVGMTVRHKVFGEGKIISVTPMTSDTLLEVAFTEAGTKKLMANYAKMEVL